MKSSGCSSIRTLRPPHYAVLRMPIKQGGPVMIALFCGFGYIVLLFVGFMLLPGRIWSGAFGCLIAALNFRNVGSDNENHED